MPPTTEEASSRWAQRIAEILSSGPFLGALGGVVLFVLGTLSLDKLSYFGQTSDALRKLAIQTYGPQVALESARYLALYVAFGLIGGLGSQLIWAVRDRLGAGPPRSWALRVLRHAGLLTVAHLFFLCRSVVLYPQLYTEALYDQGGARASLQVLLTDWLSPGLLDILAIATLGALVLSPRVKGLGRADTWRALGRADTWRPLGRADTWRARLNRRGLMTIAVVLALTAGGLGLGALVVRGSGGRANRGPNVLILAVDSLRADRLESPRYRSVTPRLRELAARSVQFRHAYATLARTFPSWVTLLTGREPHDHGIRHMFPSWAARRRIGPTLPRVLRRAGVRTEVVSDYAGEIFGRVDLGFETVSVPAFSFYEIVRQRVLSAHVHLLPYLATGLGRRLVPPLGGLPQNADPLLLARRINARLDRLAHERRFFLAAFFSVAHFPYAAPYPYYQQFTRRAYRGKSRYMKQRGLGRETLSAKEVEHVRGLYDGAVAAADAAMGQVLDHLRRLGLDRNTVVIITADHGENLYEADLGMGHGDHLRGEAGNRVPLILHDPALGDRARQVTAITRDVDLAPTLAKRMGVRLPRAAGRDLTPLLRGEPPSEDRAAFMETGLWFTREVPGVSADLRLPYPPVLGGLVTLDEAHQRDLVLSPRYATRVVAAKHRAIRTRRWKLLYVPLVDRVRTLLYDVQHDPLCQRDVARAHPKVARRLADRLRRWILREPGSQRVGDWVLPGPRGRP